MKRIWIGILAAFLAVGADKAQDAERALKAAMNTELVDGNLKAAIEQYRKAAQSGVRPVAAEALLHMAECYQKLGDSESRKIYEQIARDYADQRGAAAIARAKLGLGTPTSGVTARQMWTGPKVDNYGSVSRDGRFLSFTDWETGDLAIHDFTTGQDRRLTNKGPWAQSSWQAIQSVISPGGKQVAYDWHDGISIFELRVIDLDSGKSRILVPNTPGMELVPGDWSSDGKWIGVHVFRGGAEKDQIGLVSTADGDLRILKSGELGVGLWFSPDGKYLACDTSLGPAGKSEIHLLATDGSSETNALTEAANDRVLGWSPDGKRLLFASDRSGLTGIWAITISNGRPQERPELIKANVNPSSVGVTRSGALYYSVTSSGRDIYVAQVDFETGKILSTPTPMPQPFLGLNDFPRWSPDGKYLAYLSRRDANGHTSRLNTLAVRSVETGNVRELDPGLMMLNRVGNFSQPLWSPDGGSLLVNGADKQSRSGVYRIDARTGEAAPVVLNREKGPVLAIAWSHDGRMLYLIRRGQSGTETLVAVDMQSGEEREILRREAPLSYVGLGWAALSPDGKLLAVTAFDRGTQSGSLLVIPSGGGEPRELLRTSVTGPDQLGAWVEWSPDGRYVIFRKGMPTRENFRIPVEGGAAVKYAGEWMVGPSSTNPDGRQVAFAQGEHKIEIWALENLFKGAGK
jgi:Tol biopolymer transport system component